MITFQSHVPSFFDAEPAVCKSEYESIEDILNLPWIKGWNNGEESFQYYWSAKDGVWSKCLLMAMWNDPKELRYGKSWWVLGYMSDIPDSLPEWKCPPRIDGIKDAENDQSKSE